ncbi:hypothetical protein FRZ06_13205 [Anoxybacterium hadale]|uniref:Uncharacterized protein n=1 Tax=Anoxybacterium hadale TaxID=3408580 RepID=A0ACD1ADC6_9FIRM|nr:hypothetical protein FRZ06_13205 [Clostridiales bacterium]
MLKKCALCGQEKNISEFGKNSRNKDGLHSYCKECNSKKAKEYNKTEKGKANVIKALKKQQSQGYFRYGKGAIQNISKSAKNRGIEFTLTEAELSAWWKNNTDVCYYCNTPIEEYRIIRDFILNYEGNEWDVLRFKRFFERDVHAKINDMTLDRVDNKKGYSIENIVKSCWICNSLKSDFYTADEMRLISPLIIKSISDKMKE